MTVPSPVYFVLKATCCRVCDEIYTHWINSVTSITLAIVIWYLDNLHNRKYRHLWWEENITEQNGKDIRPEKNSVDLETDASNSGWEPNLNSKTTGDRWLDYGSAQNINFLEVRLGEFCKSWKTTRWEKLLLLYPCGWHKLGFQTYCKC